MELEWGLKKADREEIKNVSMTDILTFFIFSLTTINYCCGSSVGVVSPPEVVPLSLFCG